MPGWMDGWMSIRLFKPRQSGASKKRTQSTCNVNASSATTTTQSINQQEKEEEEEEEIVGNYALFNRGSLHVRVRACVYEYTTR